MSLPNTDRERVRNQSKKFRELIAFGVTPDRWEWDIKNLRDSGDLLNPEADTERLMGLWETRNDLIPGLDATDHALDYLDELEKAGGNANAPATAFDALNSYTGQAGQAPGVSATAPLIRDAVLRYGPGQDALPQATTALYNPEQVSAAYGDGATGGLYTPTHSTQRAPITSNPNNPPVVYRDNIPVPSLARGSGNPVQPALPVWPTPKPMPPTIANPTGGKRRDDIPEGLGSWDSDRVKEVDGKTVVYPHRATDVEAIPGQTVVSPITGRITHTGVAYRKDDKKNKDEPDYGSIHIEGTGEYEGLKIKLLYVDTSDINVGDEVSVGAALGLSQDIGKRYGQGMTPHVHMQVYWHGKLIDPETILPGWKRDLR